MMNQDHDPGPTRRPPLLSVLLSVGAGTVTLVSLMFVPEAAGIAAISLALLGGGLLAGSRRLLEGAGAGFVLAIVVGGWIGVPAAFLAVATLFGVVAWDVADHAIDLGRQIGRDARTRRNELAHAAGSLFVGCLTGGIAFGAFLGMTGGQPITALAFLLCGAIALVVALT